MAQQNLERERESFHSFFVHSSSSFVLSWQGHQDLDVVDREVPGPAADAAVEPVVVDLLLQQDHVALLERQLAGILGLEEWEGAK